MRTLEERLKTVPPGCRDRRPEGDRAADGGAYFVIHRERSDASRRMDGGTCYAGLGPGEGDVRPLGSLWLVRTPLSRAGLRERLSRCINGEDDFMIVPAQPSAPKSGIDRKATEWLAEIFFWDDDAGAIGDAVEPYRHGGQERVWGTGVWRTVCRD